MDVESNGPTFNSKTTGSKNLTLEIVHELLIDQCVKMKATDSVYKLEREELERFSNQIRAENCNILYTTLQAKVNFSSHEKFLSSYYAYVVKFGFQMLVEVKEYTSKIILIKLADSLYTRHQKKQRKEVEETSHNLSDRQLAGLQYLSGYVIHKLYKKSKNCKAWGIP